MPQEGMLVQIDGSHHKWLEERGPHLTLLLSIDDATGSVPFALFQAQEDTEGYFRLMQGIIQRKGIPLALYSDRYLVFRYHDKKEDTPEESLNQETQAHPIWSCHARIGCDSNLCPESGSQRDE